MSRAMAESRLAVLLVLFTFWFLACAAQYTYDVYPACLTNKECLTLSDIVNERDKYFTSNVTLFFHPGNHSLQGKAVFVANISNLTLQGSTTSSSSDAPVTSIVCDNSSLSFSGVSDLHIISINFVSCRSSLSFTVSVFQDCNFENSTAINGGAITVNSGSNVTFLRRNVFTGNTATQNGGSIYADDSIITISGKATFTDNHAISGGGGGVYVRCNNTLNFSGTTTFDRNEANKGGALFVDEHNTLSFSGNSIFEGNTAEFGGALYSRDDNSLSFSGNSTLEGNTANFGGALNAYMKNTWSFSGTNSFDGNTAYYRGGALLVTSNNTLSFSGTNNFHKNTAKNYDGALFASRKNSLRFGGGGAIYAVEDNILHFSQTSTFKGNTAAQYGGTLYVDKWNILTFNGTNSFEENTVEFKGGAMYAAYTNTLIFSGNSIFERNTAKCGGVWFVDKENTLSFSGNSTFEGNGNTSIEGGALYAKDYNTLSFNGTSTFDRNTAKYGGALFIYKHNTLHFSGNSFEENAAHSGGAIYAEDNNTLCFSGNSNFDRNTAEADGGVLYVHNHNTLKFSEKCSFEGNTAENDGGALYAWEDNTLNFSGNSSFERNTAVYGGSFTVYENNTLTFNGNSSFQGNAAGRGGGALYAYEKSTLRFNGNSTFERNRASTTGGSLSYSSSIVTFAGGTSFTSNTALFGGAIYSVNSITKLTESSTFRGNNASNGGGIFVQGGRITFQGAGNCSENSASLNGSGGVILAISSIVQFSGSYQIVSNTAGYGGGMALVGIKDRTLLLESATNLSFIGNVAHKRGGALYVEDNPFTYCNFNTSTQADVRSSCFMQFFDLEQHVCIITGVQLIEHTTGIQFNYILNFENNTAVESGDVLYGGDLDSCGVCLIKSHDLLVSFQGSTVFGQVTNANMSSPFEISSDPYKVCVCENNQPNCNQTTVDVHVYPGHMWTLSLVSVGQMNGVVPSRVIRAESENLKITSGFKGTQPAENNKSCTELQYPLLSKEMSARLELFSDEPCSTSGLPLTVHITFLPCPVGFTLSDQGMCICHTRLQKYTQSCVIQNLTINRDRGDSFWVGVENTSKLEGLILHPHCPFDYCTEKAVNFTLNRTDLQCLPGRSGVLCGACQSGHCLALGSSRCLSGCSNKSLTLLLAFTAAGGVLVAFLFLCRLTVAEGTLSGLIFYANFLAVNQTIFFPAGTTNILTVFIAWLNLDLGIEMCFFVGLDTYSRTWLQFVFPIYIWVLVGLVIYLANVSSTFARIISRTNPVAVLATLFLLSYTKLLRAIMAAFSFTSLDYPDNESRLVWLYDGNIGYLDKQDGRHVVLCVVSLLVFLFIFLPYTLLLLCGQWIQRKFQLRWLSPKKRLYLKAFLDAYYAPFHDKHRYWTGLLLLLRFFIVLLSTVANIGHFQDPFVSLVVLLCVVSGMLLWGWFIDRLYKKWYLNILEASFMFNLIVLIGGTYQVNRMSGGNQAALVYTSVSIAFTTFIGMVISPVMRQVKKLCEGRHHLVDINGAHNSDDEEPLHLPAAALPSSVTHSVVEIVREHSQAPEDVVIRPLLETATY